MTQEEWKLSIAVALKEKYGSKDLGLEERMSLQAEIKKVRPDLSDFATVLAVSHIDRIRLENLS